MKIYVSFDLWYKDQTLSHKRLINRLRRLVHDVSPEFVEASKWSNGVFIFDDLPLIFIHKKDDHIQFGFFAGASLDDPDRLLRGKGQSVRHIRIDSVKDIEEDAFRQLILRALDAPRYK
jgi:hypothetical protein